MKKKKNKNLPIDNGLPKYLPGGFINALPIIGASVNEVNKLFGLPVSNMSSDNNSSANGLSKAAEGLAEAAKGSSTANASGAGGGLGSLGKGAGKGVQSLGSKAAGSLQGNLGNSSNLASGIGALSPLIGATGKAVAEMVNSFIEPEENYRTTFKNIGAHYANGGEINIKPSKRGTFTAAAKKRGKGVQEFASQVLANKDKYSPAMVKKANFARNAAKWKKAMGGLVEPEIFEMGGLTGTYMDAFDAMGYGGNVFDNPKYSDYMALGGLTGVDPTNPPKRLPALNKELYQASAAELIGGPIQNFANYHPEDLERVKLGYYKSGQEYQDAFNKLEDAYGKYNAITDEDRQRVKQENPNIFNPLMKSYNSAKFYQCDGCYGSSDIQPSNYKETVHPVTGRKINVAEFERPVLKRTTTITDNRSNKLPEEEFKLYSRLTGEGYGMDKRTGQFVTDRKEYMNAYKSGNLEKIPFKKPSNETALIKQAMGGYVNPLMALGGMIDPSMYMEQMMYGSYAEGGQVPQNIPVEVEGEEMYELPDGQTGEFQGPKHENGGIPIALPEGTKIYSDRLKVNGKTMAARKEKRDNNIKKLEKLLTKNPSDRFIKEAIKRQQETASLEEQGDMQMQEQANQQQAQQEQMMEEMLMGAAQEDIQQGMMAMGGMIKRADGSYSQRGLWDNIRANRGSGKRPTKEMLKQEKKIRAAEKAMGGLVKYSDGTPIAGIPQVNYANPYIDPYAGLMQNPMLQSSMPTEFDVNTFGYNSYSPSYADAVLNNNIGNTYGVTAGIENTIPRTNMPEPINIEETSLRSTYTPTFESNVPAPAEETSSINLRPINATIGDVEESLPSNYISQKEDKSGFDLSDIFGIFGGGKKDKKEKTPKAGGTTKSTSGDNVRYTEGDRMGMMGNMMGMFGPSAMTMLNRLETPKNKNFFSEFGQEALRTQMEAEGIAGMAKDEAYRKNLMRSNALRKQLANSARGVGDMRTQQLAAALSEQEGARDILGSYLQGMSGLKGQRAQLQQQIDQTRMGGEYQRDLADRQDIDQFYTNLAENLATASEFTQKQGKDMNTALRNKDIMSLAKYYSAYGIYPDFDEKGNIVFKDDSNDKTLTVKEAQEKKKKMDEETKKAAGTTSTSETTSLPGLDFYNKFGYINQPIKLKGSTDFPTKRKR